MCVCVCVCVCVCMCVCVRERVECGAVSDCVDTYIDIAGTDIVTHIVLRRQNNPLFIG